MTDLPPGLCDAVALIMGRSVPQFDDLDRLGEWLGAQGVGLIRVQEPSAFSWPGHWIAITERGGVIVMFGTPSGPVTGAIDDDEVIVDGFVVAPHDLDLERRVDRTHGIVQAIVVASATAGAAHHVGRVRSPCGTRLGG